MPLSRRTSTHRTAALAGLAVALALAGCGGTTGAPRVSGASPPPPCNRGPAMVQIENSPDARPLAGVQQANLVYEYRTEGGITRLTAIFFHPSGTQKIEPVRSARLITLRLQKAYHGLVFYSGASDHVQGLIWSAHVPSIRDDGQHAQYFGRDPGRYAPHNLYTEGDRLAQGQAKSAPCVSYPAAVPGTPATAGAAVANQIGFDQTPSHRSVFTYAPQVGAYKYAVADTGVMIDRDTGAPIHIKNLVLIQVAHHNAGYTEDVAGAPGIDFDLTGTGPADVFTGGHRYPATWDLNDPNSPLKIVGGNGKPFPMPDGLTWISIIDPGTPIGVS
ncbi:MAG: DUF3048 domain-containing protein [Candidatus Dormibacteraceae bacterium]